MTERPGSDGVDPTTLSTAPLRPMSTGGVAVGRVLNGVGDIIEGKPPRDGYEHVVEADESGEPEDPEDVVIKI